MEIILPDKLVDKNLDEIIHRIYNNHKAKPSDRYFFDFTNVEYIGNQELLVVSGLFKTFVASNVEFEVSFFRKGVAFSQIDKRVKKQIIQFWVVWKIWQIVPSATYDKYFGIDGNAVENLQKDINYYPRISEIYTRHGITPFVFLDHIHNYNESEVRGLVNPFYKLNNAIEELLRDNNCQHPFTSKALSTIITEELYLNFLDHSRSSSFEGFEQFAFMSISVQAKLDAEKIARENPHKVASEEIQKQKALNFRTECLEESKDFFYDNQLKEFKNISYIQFSFLDFGLGIPNTLEKQFRHAHPSQGGKNYHSDILRYAFNYDSSRNQIKDNDVNLGLFIPRGLFDVLTIVRRYKGLLVVRSDFGKILFDFSVNNNVDKAFSYFGNPTHYFPGTLISAYIPSLEEGARLNVSSIKPELTFSKVKPENIKYVSLKSISREVKLNNRYVAVLSELKRKICYGDQPSLVFLSLQGERLEESIIRKTIYFLLSDYDINHRSNVVILGSPRGDIIQRIADEILELNDAIKNYKLHPLPIIDYNEITEDINVTWLGIYDATDKEKLNQLLYEQYSIARSDFNDPENISGHLNEFDSYGNLLSNFPSRDSIVQFYLQQGKNLISERIEDLLTKHNCIKKDDNLSLYLCNGNYYQREYAELNNLVNDKSDCYEVARLLYGKIRKRIGNKENYRFIGITTTGHRLLRAFELQGLISKDDYDSLDIYHMHDKDWGNEIIDATKKYILICDVVSTGFLTQKLNDKLKDLGTNIEFVAVIMSVLSPGFQSTNDFIVQFHENLIFLHEHPIEKFKRNQISQEVIEKNIIRVNPHTNIPVTLNIDQTNYNESIIFPSSISYDPQSKEIIIKNEFLDSIDPTSIYVGFLLFNNVIHPYFFDTDIILEKLTEQILGRIIERMNKPVLSDEVVKVFYPRKSGVANFNFELLKRVLKNHAVEEIEIERFSTPEGWRFPHNTDYLTAKIENTVCFILDDGSCSGDSLIQMIDEISFYNVKEIILMCFIGRVNDHKREFFSRLSGIKVRSDAKIPVSIFFACHWHIPTYYLDENPNVRETTWLNAVISTQNTPQSIKGIARAIIKAIKPRRRKINFEDYGHLPRQRGSREIPKHELLLIREELGKVIGYRFYKESFTFFDYFIKKYEKIENTKNRYREIELLCGCFVYEPYLYEKIENVLPDVVEKMEEFVRILIFSNKRIESSLTYAWDKRDIVHLFFIVFKNEKLVKELTRKNIILLAQFAQPKEFALDYILYKLLHYFPIASTEISKYGSEIKRKLLDISESEDLAGTVKAKIKIYRWFISSLPSSNTYSDGLSKLKSNFERIVDQKYHDDNIYNDKQIINSVLLDLGNKIRKGLPYEGDVVIIQTHWENIAMFLEDILSFSRAFPGFFVDEKMLTEIDGRESSLRKLYGELTEIIYGGDFRGGEVGKKLNEVFTRFVLNESHSYKIFSKPHSMNANHIIEAFIKRAQEKFLKCRILWNDVPKTSLDFPQHFLDSVLREVFTNLRHIDPDRELKINVSLCGNSLLKIKIWNYWVKPDLVAGGGNAGMRILRNLNNPFHGTYYKRYFRGDRHLQIIKIKML